MELKKEQPKKETTLKLPLGVKRTLLLLLVALAAKMGIEAKEIYNAPVVEYFERVIGETGEALVGVDSDGDGLADTFIVIRPLKLAFVRRLANFIQSAGVISYEDEDKKYSNSLGADSLSQKAILEVGGKSILEIFPNLPKDFPYEAARRARLQNQSNGSRNNPIKTILANAQPAILPQHFRRNGRG